MDTDAVSDALILISNDLSHPALSKQQYEFSWRINRLRPLLKKGYRLIVIPAGGKVNPRGLPALSGLAPQVTNDNGLTIVSPPIVRIPILWVLQSILVTPLMILLYCKTARIRVSAVFCSTVVFGAIGKIVNRFIKAPLVVDYGDPDYAREKSLSLRLLHWLETYVFQRPGLTAVTFIDPHIGAYISRYRVAKKLFLPPGGLNRGQRLQPETRVTPRGQKTVLYAGHVAPPPTYRLDLLPEAASEVLKKAPSTQFVVVGSGSYLPELKRRVRELGIADRFEFPGAVSYAESLESIRKCDVALQLLNDMCLGTKVLDYFALGKAVVASGLFASSYHEFLRSGENCMLVAPDLEKLTASILLLLNDDDLRTRIGMAARKEAELYDWTYQSERLLEFAGAGRIQRK